MIKIIETGSYKVGVNEVRGLKAAIAAVLSPIKKELQNKVYWSTLKFEDREYLRRDGFVPHAHNCGGLEISLHVPKCEEYDFDFLEFGEYGSLCDDSCSDDCECDSNNDGELDAFCRVALVFEGVQADGRLKFFLFLEGGNQDAPYFRSKHLPTLFEAEFFASSVSEVRGAAKKHVAKLLKIIKGT